MSVQFVQTGPPRAAAWIYSMHMTLSVGVKAQQHKFFCHALVFSVYYTALHDKFSSGVGKRAKRRKTGKLNSKRSYVTRENSSI